MISIDKKRKFDWTLFLSVISLVLLGTLAIMSSTIMLDFRERVIRTHIIAVFIGIFAMLFMWVFDYNMLDEHSNKIYVFFLFLLLLVLFLGVADKGSKSWFRLPFFSLQPSEFARISLIIVLSSYLSKYPHSLNDPAGIIKFFLITLPFFILMAKQPDFSGILITCFPLLVICIVGGINLNYIYIFIFYLIIVLLIPAVGVIVNLNPDSLNSSIVYFLYTISYFNINSIIFILLTGIILFLIWMLVNKLNPLINISYFVIFFSIIFAGYLSGIFIKSQIKDYQYKRIESFIYPDKDPKGSGYNIIQARVALGSGGIRGKGLFSGTQSRLGFVPERHTDFILSVIGEEMGIIGVLIIIAAYTTLINRIKKIAVMSRDIFGYYMSCGFAGLFMGYFFINIGMILGFFPIAGVPLAFVSYGGSNIVASFIIIGILESIYTRRLMIA
jgi:rod shape determining protein RodA